MRKIFAICLYVCCCMSVLAAPYGLLINGTTKLEAIASSDKDFQGREQFKVSCVKLAQGDKVQLHDFGSGASWMCAIDPYGEYQKFTKGTNDLTCSAAGTYDFYIKLKYEDDLLYIGPGEDCVEFDPATPYYITGNAALVGDDKKWSSDAIEMNSDATISTYTYTFTRLLADTVYKMKITDGTWEHSWGYTAVQNPHPGITRDADGNIVFALKTTGEVSIGFDSGKISLTGNFTDVPPINPTFSTSVPSQCPDVMLQGFYWDSNQDKYYGNTRWKTLQGEATDIAAYFDLVWLPPSALSTGGVGYIPKQYSNQNSDWGKREDLETLIKTLHDGGARVVADMVVNHIDGKDGWCSFYEQDFGEYGRFQVDGSYICSGDEMNYTPDAGSCQGKATGSADDGYGDESNYGAARDLAHDSEKVREMCRAYAKWMISVMKYDGFRYDYCKGFHMSHVGDYNQAAGAYFSVLEYWDGNADVLWSRIADAWENTLAFDFGVKYDALNNGIAKGDYSKCLGPGLLGKGKGKWAVTFVDNHDTFERNDSEFGGYFNSMSDNMSYHLLEANAFILSMPGVPCIFYPHWKKYGKEIKAMISARKMAGVHSESKVSDEGDYHGYRATVTGSKAKLILELGNRKSSSHSGYTKIADGAGYAMWVENTNAVAPELDIYPNSTTYSTESLTVTMNATGGLGGSPTIYYTLDGSDPKTSSTVKIYTSALTITGTVTLKAFAASGNGQSAVQTRVYTYRGEVSTDVENVGAATLDSSLPMYNILGQPVNVEYRGIVIQNGYKYLKL